MIVPGMYPAKAEKARWIERKNGAILLDPQRGIYHKLNDTATYIWNACNGTKSIQKIYGAVANAYKISRPRAARDVNSIISRLSRAGMLKLHGSPDNFIKSRD